MDLEPIYRRGMDDASHNPGEAPSDYSRVLAGVVAVFHHLGQETSWRDLSSRWHDPLAGVSLSELFETVARRMEGVFNRDVGQRDPHHVERIERAPALSYRPSVISIEDQADELIDREIKAKYPKVRRGSKRYKELAASVFDKAVAIVKERKCAEAERHLAEVVRRADHERAIVLQVRKSAAYLRRMAEDVLLFRFGSHAAERALRTSARWVELADRYERALDSAVSRAEKGG